MSLGFVHRSVRVVMVSLLLISGAIAHAQAPRVPATNPGAVPVQPPSLSPADKALERGAKLVSICANCHGPNGNSVSAGVPNLAGQQPAYLLEQMNRFADGRRRDPFMQGMIKAMSPAERQDVVSYLAAQPVQPSPAAGRDPALVARGQAYYQRVCFRCHGPQAQGDAVIPRIAGQQVAYVTKTLKRYRDGTGERIEPAMAANTRLMNDGDIAAMAAFLATMR